MKPLFLAAAMLLTAIAMSQTTTVVDSGGNYDAQIQSTFQFVTNTGATTGKLIERAPRLINIEDYNGSRLADSLTMNFDKFVAMYIMGSAASYTGSSGLPDPDLVYNNRATINGAQVIYFLAQRYNQFDPAAVGRGQVTLAGKNLFAFTNVYVEDTLFAAAIQDTVFQTGTSSFILPASAIVSNWGTAPSQNISIDWGDGLGSRPYTVGQTAVVNYSTAGIKKVILSYIAPNGKILRTQFSVQVTVPPSLSRRPDAILGGYIEDPTHHITIPVAASRSYLGIANSVDVDVYFACDDQKIRKPLIVLDGFEPSDHNSVKASNLLATLGFSITPDNKKLGNDFREAGYDLVFVDWNRSKVDQGRDYIQRNAYLLEAILQKINDMKHANGSSEQNVVIGFSMGGVIGKYALLDMEKDNPAAANGGHDARLFIAYDAPLKGANISMGTQHFLRHFSEFHIGFTSLRHFDAKLQASFDVIHSPAATQMLIYQANDPNPYAPAAHLNFQNELEHQGMNGDGALQKCVFKAISNGSVTGKQQFNAGDIMFYGKGSLLELANLNPFVTVGVAVIQNFNPFVSIDLFAFVSVWSLPVQGGVGKIYDGFITSYTRVGFIIIPHEQHYYITIMDSRPLDTAPGGFTALGKKSIPAAFTSVNPLFCFIPAVSALEIKNQPFLDNLNLPVSDVSGVITAGSTNVKSYEGARGEVANDAATGLYVDGQTPAASGPDNQQHVSFSYRNTGFLLTELLPYKGLNSLGGTLDGRTYNFGVNTAIYSAPVVGPLNGANVSPIINFNLALNNGARLWVNRLDKINFTDLNGPQNTVNAGYLLTVGGASSGCASSTGAIININNTSEMRIGDATHPPSINIATVDLIQSGEIDVNQGGQLVTENNSNIIVESGGVLNINNGGFACAMWGAKITVKAGGTVHVFNGGILRISEYSALILDGGQLILDPSATLQLWDGQAPNGQATVWVKKGGNLVVNGNFTFSGNGFFQFDYGNKVTLNADWNLQGYDKAHRLIRLNSSTLVPAVITALEISGHSFTLSNCLVTSDGNTNLYVHDVVDVLISNVAFQGTSQTIGFYADKNRHATVTGCDFTGLKIGVLLTNNLLFYVYNSHFSNCIFGVSGTNSPLQSGIAGCTFDGYTSQTSAGEMVAVSLSNVLVNFMYGTVITGSTTLGAAKPVIGVRILNSLILQIGGGSVIQNCMTGIDAMNGYNNFQIFEGSVIQNCTVGVSMNGQINSPDGKYNGMDNGLFYMDCAALVGNQTGVYGNDVLFAIDETVNSSGQNSNYFSTTGFNKLFDVCYVTRNNITTIPARHNYWQWLYSGYCSPGPIVFPGWSLQLTSNPALCHSAGGTAITLDRSAPALSSEVLKCGFTQVSPPACATGPGVLSLSASPETLEYAAKPSVGSRAGLTATSAVIDGVGRDLAPQYRAANAALQKSDLNEAERLFGPIARITDAARKAATPEIQQIIDVARIFSRRGAQGAWMDPYNWVEGTVINKPVFADAGTMAIYPNPAENNFRINLPAGAYAVRVFNAVGALVGTANAESGVDMDTRQWANGLYTVEAVNAGAHEPYRGKLMIRK